MFGSAVEVASLFGTLDLRDNATGALRQFDGAMDRSMQKMQGFGTSISNIGAGMTRFGGQLTAAAAPLAALFGAAAAQAMNFEAAMANAGAVLGKTAAQMGEINAEILALGEVSLAGPQGVANAYYEIVSGVADATTHMAILNQAIATSEAGQADLTATTSALISVMNAYNLSADQAGNVSDVLTRMVGLGVGSMNEFAAAIPNVTGIAAQLGISFEDVATKMAFLTTKGYSASQSADYLRGSMIALINPNAAMTNALAAIGASSGSAALEMYGLTGTYERLNGVMSTDELANAVGRVEALQAVLAITGDTFEGFAQSFAGGVAGATEAARAIQRESPAFQFQLLQSKIQATGIAVGKVLLPALNRLFDRMSPIIDQVMAWVSANPELILTIAGITAAATILGPVLMGIGAALSLVGGLITFILSPIGLVTGAVLLLASVFNVDLMGGLDAVIGQIGVFFGRLGEFDGDIARTLQSMFSTEEDGSSFLSTILEGFGMTRDAAQGIAQQIEVIANTLSFQMTYTLGNIWEAIRPAWETLRDWFSGDLVPALESTFTDNIMPLLQTFQDFLGGLWGIVSPALGDLFDWFVTDGLPGILSFITDTMIPGVQTFIDLIGGIWEVVSPALLDLADWFLNTGLPVIRDFINDDLMPVVQFLSDLLGNIWTTVSPALAQLYDWFTLSIPTMVSYVQILLDKLNELVDFQGNDFLGMMTGYGFLDNLPTPNINPPDWRNPIAGMRANGGGVNAGQPYIVGERGAEMFVPRQNGTIIPNDQMGGGVTWNGNLIFNGEVADDDQRVAIVVMALERIAGGGR